VEPVFLQKDEEAAERAIERIAKQLNKARNDAILKQKDKIEDYRRNDEKENRLVTWPSRLEEDRSPSLEDSCVVRRHLEVSVDQPIPNKTYMSAPVLENQLWRTYQPVFSKESTMASRPICERDALSAASKRESTSLEARSRNSVSANLW